MKHAILVIPDCFSKHYRLSTLAVVQDIWKSQALPSADGKLLMASCITNRDAQDGLDSVQVLVLKINCGLRSFLNLQTYRLEKPWMYSLGLGIWGEIYLFW